MDDFINELKEERPPDLKARRVCCGCKIEEPADKPFKLQCSQCKDEGFVPALFCSKTCSKQTWPKHKEWHETWGQDAKNAIGTHKIILLEREEWSDYDALIVAGLRKINSGDYAGAKKLFRKAQKLDTRRPEAFTYLGSMFRMSGMESEFISNTQEGIKRVALTTLMRNYNNGVVVDVKRLKKDMWGWATGVCDLCVQYADVQRKESEIPKWFHHDDILIRVTKVALESFKEYKYTRDRTISDMTYMRAHLLSGFLHNGVHDISKEVETMVHHRTPQQLLEALALYRSLSKEGSNASDSEFFQSQAVVLEYIAGVKDRKQGTPSNDNEQRVIRAHAWVTLCGLTSPSGSAMNGKLGLVSENGLRNGRHLVTVDRYDGVKCIKPENLVEIPVEEHYEALLSTLGEEMQWRFMRNLVECEAEPKQVEPNLEKKKAPQSNC
ncbi:unknown protein [Seminavis robusta]|uniref:Uncharacterized protein n=1 Tax=Seminavis robusta TaxID=568900 RepID=A0A9N8DTM3_9STRA|nr:unknown protein [Seminavis robusta]|eukprot:Sro241_g096420.1 n/a (438) ;mRNA; f:59329-60642